VNERRLRFGVAALALVGASIAAYLLYVRHTGGELLCANGGCEVVQSSRYAEVFGVPVAALGLIGYLALLLTSLSAGGAARAAQAGIALAAFTFSAYLVYVQLALIGSVCEWCVVSDGVTTLVAALALLRLRQPADA
jgi:uncharacterized membrane protein